MPRNEIVENYKAYKAMVKARQDKLDGKLKSEKAQRDAFLKEYYQIRHKRELNDRERGKLLEDCKNYFFGNVLKGIYIGALEAATLTDEALELAEATVDKYISENGGYQAIMNKCKADTYLLAKIRRLVEDAAEEEVKNIENGNEEIDAIEDIELAQDPEDEKDSAEVASDTQLTTANITDIVAALNKSGLEIVKKGEEADNFQDGQPETDETKPDVEVPVKEPEATTDAEPAEETEVEVKEEEPAPAPVEAQEQPEATTDAVPATEEEVDTEVKEEPAEDKADEEAPEEPAGEEESELDADLNVADENNEKNEDDPDSVKVYDDEDSKEDEDIDLDSDEEGDEDIDELEDEELGDESDDLGDDEDIDIDGDGDTDIGDIDEPEATVNVDPNKTMMDELENEKEIKNAVELIRNRVADAEEAFIKRNQEDKQKIDDLLSKISQNVATVEKISSDDKEAESTKKTVEESTLIYKQAINTIIEDKPIDIFSKLTKNVSESIIKNPEAVKKYINESTNAPDFTLMVESAKVLYGFLETLNTLQLDDVNSNYILAVLNGQK